MGDGDLKSVGGSSIVLLTSTSGASLVSFGSGSGVSTGMTGFTVAVGGVTFFAFAIGLATVELSVFFSNFAFGSLLVFDFSFGLDSFSSAGVSSL